MHFSYNNIKFKKHKEENWLMMTGEITNDSDKNYSAVVFRVILFIHSFPAGNVNLTIRAFKAWQTKTFEVQAGDLEYKIIPDISKYEIYTESAY